MNYLNIDAWNRKEHFRHFNELSDPYFGVTVDVDVTDAFSYAKSTEIPFFVLYLHACMRAINQIENFKYRIVDNDKVVIHDVIHASATILRADNTFGFSFINYSDELTAFYQNFKSEKERILNSTNLYPPVNSEDCIYCSAMPWMSFSGHKEPFKGVKESVPKLAFGKFEDKQGRLKMPVAILVNHALMDGYHVSLFFKEYQKMLDRYK
ncbi:MAG: chloramphenicol acetyltransferase [Flavobacteriaceae bacterium]|nr:chloramphenicol acetyltransferase [Flavobacteriaceae bacterium]